MEQQGYGATEKRRRRRCCVISVILGVIMLVVIVSVVLGLTLRHKTDELKETFIARCEKFTE